MSEEEDKSVSEEQTPKKKSCMKGGKIIIYEPATIKYLMASPLTVSCFKHVGCFEFCEKVQKSQYHPMLTRLFITNLHDRQVTLAGVTFDMSTNAISTATGIPNVGEKWFKQGNLDLSYYEPYLKPRYKDDKKTIFPFSHLLDQYVPMMKIIMKYFTCEGRFS